MFSKYIPRVSTLLATAAAVLLSIPAQAVDLNLSQQPLFLAPTVPPLNMLVIGRDHKLYYEAYNDYTDLNGDEEIDVRFDPRITYYGYFDSAKCYRYNSGVFDPRSLAGAGNTCTGNDSDWSGNFLNYVTTARIDALRKVLYGGFRSTDTAGDTILQRTYLPQDAHSWGKEYTSVAVDGYDISQYTPLGIPATNTRHLFANTTLLTDDPDNSNPLMRVLTNRTERIWNWVSIERPVAGDRMFHGGNGPEISPDPTDYKVRVRVCKADLLEANCQAYADGAVKPIGLLQEFGGNDSMYFGLITGSYSKNTSGGVLRKRMDSISREINANGTFKTDSGSAGIIATLNRMRVTGFGGNYQYDCGFGAAARPIVEGECQMWGNPIAEMMYEGLRYFSGAGTATSAFNIAFGAGEESELRGGGLPVAEWNDPYSGDDAFPSCSKPFQTVVSDINPSYDTDQLPGTSFGSFGGSLGDLDVAALGQKIWDEEFGASQEVFIGQVGNITDGAPTPKTVSSFGNIRGLSPEEPTKRGGYYAGSVAYHGRVNDISDATGEQNTQTFAVALASPLPKIRIPVGSDDNASTITLVPFAKSVAGSGISPDGDFQPTDQIVDFYVDQLTETYGRFRVNFEDVEQGADHDMDAIAVYEYSVDGDEVTVKLTSEYAAGGITQHMGYVISGTNADGIYLEVLDQRNGDVANDTDYFLDTPPEFTGTPPAPETGTGGWDDDEALPFVTSRTFTKGDAAGAILLNDPLWYAAKWGGFDDGNDNDIPDEAIEWDADQGPGKSGVPDNYFLVTNALTLSEQLRDAFTEILARSASASSASVNSGALTTDSRVYQARFNTRNWNGELTAFGLNSENGRFDQVAWRASEQLAEANLRKIFTVNSNSTPVPFRWASLDETRRAQLADTQEVQEKYVKYLRGDQSEEGTGPNDLRERGESRLGDIVASAPLYVGAPRARYPDFLEDEPYSEFAVEQRRRRALLFVGANDGMLHAFDAGEPLPDGDDADTDPEPNGNGGQEVFAFIPQSVFPNLQQLPRRNYSHRYFVDGSPNANDVFFKNDNDWRTVLVGGLNLGGQGIYALDITDPSLLASAETNASQIYLWEFTDQNDPDLGFTYSQPAIVRLQDGSWAAVFGNGYNNTVADGRASLTGNAVLYIVNIETGEIIRKLDTGVGMNDPRAGGRPNGLATPVMVDVDGDRVIDVAYAGDLLGNLWKFNLRPTDSEQWDFAFADGEGNPEPIFKATDSPDDDGTPQPITTRPEVARGPYGAGVMIVFGTGKFLEVTDKQVPNDLDAQQTFYGLVDRDSYDPSGNTYQVTDKISRDDLVQQTITSERTDSGRRTRSTSMQAMNGNGFYLDLVYNNDFKGERSVTDPLVRSDRVIFTTLIPNSEPCEFGGSSWLMVLDLLSGGRLPEAQLDGDGDGEITNDDDPDDDEGDNATSGFGADEILSRPESLLGLLSGSCDNDRLLSSGSSGALIESALKSICGLQGRQSWRQIR